MDLKSITSSLQGELTHEMIHTQSDVAFAKEVEKELDKIKSIVNTYDLRSTEDILKEPNILGGIDKINKILTKRFGFNINIIQRSGSGLCTIPIYPPEYNILNGPSVEFVGSLKKYFSKGMVYKNIKAIKDYDNNVDAIYNSIYNSYKSLNDTLLKNHVIIDNKNAKILNLPNDYNCIIMLDICYMLHSKGYNRPSEGLMAGILHEIGHTFTSFEKSIYKVKNTIVLMDTIKESLNNSNNDPINIIKLTYNKVTNKNDLKNTSDTITIMTAIREVLDGYTFADDKTHQNSRISAEQQADQFVSRFGYGKELVNDLYKMIGNKDRVYNTYEYNFQDNIAGLYIIIILLLMTGPIGLFLIIVFMLDGISQLKDYNSYEKIYDTSVRRYLRIKQDAIRQIRLLKKDDKFILNKLEETIKIVDAKIELLNNPENKNILNRFFDKYQMNNKTAIVVNMLELSEMFTENDLHYYNMKLKNKLS